MTYEDAPAAFDWLCRALGFEQHFVVHAPHLAERIDNLQPVELLAML